MKIGYACLTVGIPNTKIRSVTQKNATDDKLREIIAHNLTSLKNMLLFNAQNGINLYRISSDIIPFGSSPVNRLDWEAEFRGELLELAEIISQYGMRVSMHPGQYTVLNSPNPDVVSRATDDLIYHTKVLDALKCSSDCKIILHVGGVYGERENAIARFKKVYATLDDKIKQHLVIENDDKSYPISDVLAIGLECGIPVVYDNLHSEVKPSGDYAHLYWIEKCVATWQKKDGTQKTHYSQQAPDKPPGAHTQTIAINEFMQYVDSLGGADIDILLEVKDKNISALKCINSIGKFDREALEAEWQRYKYKILELSPSCFKKARHIINSSHPDPIEFYQSIENAFKKTPSVKSCELAVKTVWNDCFGSTSKGDSDIFNKKLSRYTKGEIAYGHIKKFLMDKTMEQNLSDLYNSYYFYL